MVGWFIENEKMRTTKGRKSHQEARFLAARNIRNGCVGLLSRKSHLSRSRAYLGFGRIGHQFPYMGKGRSAFFQLVELMLREIGDFHFGR